MVSWFRDTTRTQSLFCLTSIANSIYPQVATWMSTGARSDLLTPCLVRRRTLSITTQSLSLEKMPNEEGLLAICLEQPGKISNKQTYIETNRGRLLFLRRQQQKFKNTKIKSVLNTLNRFLVDACNNRDYQFIQCFQISFNNAINQPIIYLNMFLLLNNLKN